MISLVVRVRLFPSMSAKILRPNTAARRQASVVDTRNLSNLRPLKRLTRPWHDQAGRNAYGRITVRHRGGGAKRLYRVLSFGEEKVGVSGVVEGVEYDPNRSAFIARVRYADGDRRYLLAWESVQVGQAVRAAVDAPALAGNRLPLEKIPVGSMVFGIELRPGRGAQLVRSAGASAVLQEVLGKTAQIRMPSGELRLVPRTAWATIGQVSNPDHRTERVGWAGRRRRMGWRPSVRGKAMNPVDHPHGGGEAHNPIGLKHPKTPWGKNARGVRTRRKQKYSDRLILKRR